MIRYNSTFISVGGEVSYLSILTTSRNQGGFDRGKESY
jgi:hypothetical protein